VKVVPRPLFKDVFEAVASGETDHGIIPIENSLAGSILENYDLLVEHNLVITGEIKLRILHNLMANEGASIDTIKRVSSHPQALMQCKDFLNTLPGVNRSVSTTQPPPRGRSKIPDRSGKPPSPASRRRWIMGW